jgi:hypothetical protein
MHQLATLADGSKLYANLIKPPLSISVSRNPHLLNLLEEVVASLELRDAVVELEYDMKRSVGYTDIIAVEELDTVFYARQTKGGGFTRFVKNRKSDQSNTISLVMVRDEAGDYELQNIWVGGLYPAVPGEPRATVASKTFWETHGVVYNGQPIISSSITKSCPY